MGFRRRDDNPYHLDDSEPNVKPPFINHRGGFILYNRYKIHSLSLTLIHNLRINLSRADITVTK